MAQKKVSKVINVIERNIQLTSEIMRYLLDHPQLFDALPNDFELVILPDDDPEMRLYNLDLLDKYGSEGKPVVFARTKSSIQASPNLFVPVPIAA
jgi:hypothetical protein